MQISHATPAALWRPPETTWSPELTQKVEAADALIRDIGATQASAVLATSLQVEEVVLTDLIVRSGAKIGLFMLETGRLSPETLAAKADVEAHFAITIEVFRPDPAEIAQWISRNGENGFYDSAALRHQCCAIRKVRPLERALEGRTAWVTGQRRDQASTRGDLNEREFDAAHGIDKFNPLAKWSLEDVWSYARTRDLPVNALYARGYASIGCEPCTRAIRADEDVRAGRWWWEASDAKECGLHLGEGI